MAHPPPQDRPVYVQTLSEPFYTDRKGEIPEGKKGYYEMPIVHAQDGLVTVNYGGEFIQVGAPRHAALQPFPG